MQGTIGNTCNTISGTVQLNGGQPRFDGRVRGCAHPDGSACSTAEFESLDTQGGNSGQQVNSARFTMVRVADGITCAQARATPFP